MKTRPLSLLAMLACTTLGSWAQDYDYIERSWDATNKQVIAETKTIAAGQYTAIHGRDISDEGWLPLYDGWYVVTSNSHYKVLNVLGTDVRLIIPDSKDLTLDGGVKVETGHTLTIYGQTRNSGTLHASNSYSGAAGIGGGEGASAGTINIHGSYITVTGGPKGAGIGGGKNKGFDGGLNIYGGTVFATGGEYGAGIGSGDENSSNLAGYVNIYGGNISAKGGIDAAGIGGGEKGNGAVLNVYGGSVVAERNGSSGAAAIGGGRYGNGVQTFIHGGYVRTTGTIGGGPGSLHNGKGNGGYIEINGGTVVATGRNPDNYNIGYGTGAGIGCGASGESATIRINGGTVTASAGDDTSAGIGGGGGYTPLLDISITGGTVTTSGYQGIGPGSSSFTGEKDYSGSLSITGGKVYATGIRRAIGGNDASGFTIYNEAMVKAGATAEEAMLFSAGERVAACLWRKYAAIEPCTHSGATYTVNGTTSSDTHTAHCYYCTTTFAAEPHNFSNSSTCSVCGVSGTAFTITIYYPNTATDGDYTTTTYQMVPNSKFKLPAPPNEPGRMEFAGWLVGTPSNNSFITNDDEMLLEEDNEYTITSNVTFTARYRYIDISLANDADNSETLSKYNIMIANTVTLTEHTLYKDGKWNTLCLPFEVDMSKNSPLAGGTAMTLDTETSSLSGSTLTLNFKKATGTILAGTPFIIKWEGDGTSNITDPVFDGVLISTKKRSATSVDGSVTFTGTYAPVSIPSTGDNTKLYLGASNTLYYPSAAMTIGTCHAYFELNKGLTAGEPASGSIRAFVVNFGDQSTGVTATDLKVRTEKAGAWYDLQGRKMSGQLRQKGIYIKEGKKIVIK